MLRAMHAAAVSNTVSEEISDKEIFHSTMHLFQASVHFLKILSKTLIKELGQIPKKYHSCSPAYGLAFPRVSCG